MINLRVIEGGLLPKEKCEKHFISAYITGTRLMGAMGMYVHWRIIDSPETEDLHQFFYFDSEEFGFETYKSVWSDDIKEVNTIANSLIGCLGGSEIPVTLNEAKEILNEYVYWNKEHEIALPEGSEEYAFLISPEPYEFNLKLFKKECEPIDEYYQLINYFLMRCFGQDFVGANFLSKEGLNTNLYPDLPITTLCKNTIDEKDDFFICQSLIDVNNHYQLLVSKIKIKDMKIVLYEQQSGFSVSAQEAAMMLTRPEFITVYEILEGPKDLKDEDLEFDFNTMITTHENGRLFLAFNQNNDHVKKQIFRLSEDVFGLYYITDFGQLILASYNMKSIKLLEKNLLKSSFGSYLLPTAKYEFKEPVLYEFIQSDYDDFDDFLEEIKDND